MTKKMITVTGLCLAVCLMLSSAAYSVTQKQVSAAKPRVVELEGTVNVVKDVNSTLTSVKLTTAKSNYNVVLNSKGLELGQTDNGKKVEVTGTVAYKNKERWLTVKSFKLVEDKPKTK